MTTDISSAWVPTGRTLAENEAIIGRGIDGFIEIGIALTDVRETHQYRDAGYDSFSAYLTDRWPQFSRTTAYRAIDTARVAGLLSPMGDIPLNERQARELAPLRDEPDAVREVWQQAHEEYGDDLTAADLREAVHAYRAPEEEAADHEATPVPAREPEPYRPRSQDVIDEDERRRPLHEFHMALDDMPQWGLLSYKPKALLPVMDGWGDRINVVKGLRAVRGWLEGWEKALSITPAPSYSSSQAAAVAAIAGVGWQALNYLTGLKERDPKLFEQVLQGAVTWTAARKTEKERHEERLYSRRSDDAAHQEG